MSELVFYTNPMSRGRIARWALEEIGQPYRTQIVAYGPAMKGPEYRAIHPLGKVPALVHGQTTITETAAICAYLADAFPQAGLAPELGSPARGAYLRWLFFAAGPVEMAVSLKSLGVNIPDEKKGTIGTGSVSDVCEVLESVLSAGPYLAGDKFTMADVYCGSQIGFGLRFGGIEPRAVFVDYMQRISNRPAAVRAGGIDDALIAAASGG